MTPRLKLLLVLASMPDEALSWIALSMLEEAKDHGALTAVWPEGLGGFHTCEDLDLARATARDYLESLRT